LASDGNFGGRSDAAVRQLQRANGLAADGVVGPLTWAALFRGDVPFVPPARPSGPPSMESRSDCDMEIGLAQG
jgi:peptidoglycan hydrolase-like protein with peptidoglycan-binding domain